MGVSKIYKFMFAIFYSDYISNHLYAIHRVYLLYSLGTV